MAAMTSTTDPALPAGDLAQALFTGNPATDPVPVLTYPAGAGRVARREALRPVYEEIVARIGAPTLLGGAVAGPRVRWCTRERILQLSGDHSQAVLTAYDADEFERAEWKTFDTTHPGDRGEPHAFDALPYLWQLDRKGPGFATSWTYNGTIVVSGWEHAAKGLELMLASWVEHYPVQSPGDWIGFKLWTARDWGRSMTVSYSPNDEGHELAVAIDDRGAERTEERQARMRERGWRVQDEHQWWRTTLPETDEDAPRVLAELAIAECRARKATCVDELRALDISAGDHGDLWLTGLGLPTQPSRGEHW